VRCSLEMKIQGAGGPCFEALTRHRSVTRSLVGTAILAVVVEKRLSNVDDREESDFMGVSRIGS
jgi:hypothetical protein